MLLLVIFLCPFHKSRVLYYYVKLQIMFAIKDQLEPNKRKVA